MSTPIMEVELWEAQVFEFGIELPIPEMPKPSLDWGGAGIELKATCPGAAFCGNPNAEKNCTVGMKHPFKIPSFSVQIPFPPDIQIPPLKVKFAFPPKVILPIHCPAYPKSEGPPQE